MVRRRTTSTADQPAEATSESLPTAVAEFEQQAADLQPMTAQEIVADVAANTELPPEQAPTEAPTTRVTVAEEPKKEYPKAPDPFAIASMALTDDRDGPRIRLYRNNKKKLMALQFDEKPVGPEGDEKKYTQMLRDAGFSWDGRDKVWTKDIDPDEKWRAHADAEKVLHAIGQAIREDRGLGKSTVDQIPF